MTKLRSLVAVLIVLVGVVGAAFAASNFQQETTPVPDQFRGLIEDLRGQGATFSVEFAASLPTGAVE
jgi:ABC-type phosphate transport system substrate-binding protein